MDRETAQVKLLDAAEELFYARGIQTVGMDDIRSTSGVSLKRLYQVFPAKEQLVEAYLDRRDTRWRARLAEHVDTYEGPERRLLAVFDWLELWFGEPGFRGCAWINSYGELGGVSEGIRRQARHHKEAFRAYLGELAAAAGLPAELAGHLLLLAEGAMVTAGIFGRTEPARQARTAAATLIEAARRN
ncbi:TetR/AcrR family transcriptional regulator [Amycolatopsis acidiphila]|uniref:TetR/AcrR family transcriptional regulator n=1 Tax=Amycolatopsis acidiphila TaxID=715473 RepID=A0A558AJZ6_9PSEU|nr:TetR/AcrR family transcriptional regulator [Amycolatopsis acidiphila]TVT24595.1 TetR/AcrR family transcriptional regulator [Amycolatopsis acidiphila]UIJ58543.1 TetR/AcrR family transcriptional regulator [Amycolatopsis acidiphila]GHG76936.1 TetR family transcriptional regulator [Amycolatopsis acidiphila]